MCVRAKSLATTRDPSHRRGRAVSAGEFIVYQSIYTYMEFVAVAFATSLCARNTLPNITKKFPYIRGHRRVATVHSIVVCVCVFACVRRIINCNHLLRIAVSVCCVFEIGSQQQQPRGCVNLYRHQRHIHTQHQNPHKAKLTRAVRSSLPAVRPSVRPPVRYDKKNLFYNVCVCVRTRACSCVCVCIRVNYYGEII